MQLCPGSLRRDLDSGKVVDLTELHEDHTINLAARCKLLRGLEPALILAVCKQSPHDFRGFHRMPMRPMMVDSMRPMMTDSMRKNMTSSSQATVMRAYLIRRFLLFYTRHD